MKMSILIFKSATAKPVYCWNGKETITIIGNKNKPFIGNIMSEFENKQLKFVYNEKLVQFWIGQTRYKIVGRV